MSSYLDELDRIADHSLLWYTSDDRAIPVRYLADGHLLNIERYLRFEGEQQPDPATAIAWYPVINREVSRRNLRAYEAV